MTQVHILLTYKDQGDRLALYLKQQGIDAVSQGIDESGHILAYLETSPPPCEPIVFVTSMIDSRDNSQLSKSNFGSDFAKAVQGLPFKTLHIGYSAEFNDRAGFLALGDDVHKVAAVDKQDFGREDFEQIHQEILAFLEPA